MKLFEFYKELRSLNLPPDVVQNAKMRLLDTLGVMAKGYTMQMGQSAIRSAKSMSAPSKHYGAKIVFDGQEVSWPDAAMAGGYMVDSYDCHDGYMTSRGHIGAAAVPALLAVVDCLERYKGVKVTGADMVKALVLCYEVASRCGDKMHATWPTYHTSGVWTGIGVAAMTCYLMGASEDVLRHALGLAEFHGPCGCMMRVIEYASNIKDGLGWGPKVGISSYVMAEQGFEGAPSELVELNEVSESYGDDWLILVHYYKRWPICRWAHCALLCAERLFVEMGPVTSKDIESIVIETSKDSVSLGTEIPTCADGVQYTMGYPLALMLLRGDLHHSIFTSEHFRDPEADALTKKITAVEADDCQDLWRRTRKRKARVTFSFSNGSSKTLEDLTGEFLDNPVSDEQLIQKYSTLMNLILDEKSTKQLADIVVNLENLTEDDRLTLKELLYGQKEGSKPLDSHANGFHDSMNILMNK